MKKLVLICLTGCAIAVTTACVLVLNEARLLLKEQRRDISILEYDAVILLDHAGDAVKQVSDTAGELALAAQEQRAYWKKTSLETYKTMASLRLLIVRTDSSLNDVLRPLAANAVTHAGGLADAGIDTVRDIQPVLSNLDRASSAAADRMADPHIGETLAHLDDASASLSQAGARLADTTERVDETTALIEGRVRQLTKPASLAARIGGELLGYTVKAAQIAAGFFK